MQPVDILLEGLKSIVSQKYKVCIENYIIMFVHSSTGDMIILCLL
jgi:hypothetical protein